MINDKDSALDSIDRKLSTILKILAYQTIEGKTLAEGAPLLRRLGFTASEIADVFGTNAKVVSVRLAEAKKKRSK